MEMYAMYLRKSRTDLELEALGEGETLARHRQILFDVAARHDVTPDRITVYQEVVSGDSIFSRPEMQRLLSDVYQRKYRGVFVMEVERLARGNTKDQGEVSDAFQYSGTHIITPVKEYDPANEFDQEYFEFGLFMSRREYKTIKRRMEAGRIQAFREGNYVGNNPPYGYDACRINKKERILVINPEEARIVRMIFDMFTADRCSCGQIARKLTDLKIPTRSGNPEWNAGTVRDILKNVHYIGKVRWFHRKCSKEYDADSGSLLKTKRRNTDDDQQICDGKHEPIISEEQFSLAQSLFTGVAPVKANTTISNPFAGILRCADCGKTIALSTYGSRPGTADRFVHRQSAICSKKSCEASVLKAAFVDSLNAYIADFELKLSEDTSETEALRQRDIVSTLESELGKLEKRRQRLFDSWEADDGTYTRDEFIERKNLYHSEIEEIKKQIREAKAAIPEPVDYSEKITTLHQMIDMVSDPDADAKAVNSFLKDNIQLIKYDVVDNGRNKGAVPVLDVYLKY